MSDGARHDVIYLFSMSNNIWSFDAKTGAAIWAKPSSLGAPFLPKLGDAQIFRGNEELARYMFLGAQAMLEALQIDPMAAGGQGFYAHAIAARDVVKRVQALF